MPDPDERPRGGRGPWAAAAILLIVGGVAVPYGLLSGAPPGLGIAAFWTGFGLAVAALILAAVLPWRD